MKRANWKAAPPVANHRLLRRWLWVGLLFFVAGLAGCQVQPEAQPGVVVEAAMSTATVMPATGVPPPTAVPSTPTATPSPTLTPAPTVPPTAPPIIQPTDTATPAPEPPWLAYLNRFRQRAGLPNLVEDPALSVGSAEHSIYMLRFGTRDGSLRYGDGIANTGPGVALLQMWLRSLFTLKKRVGVTAETAVGKIGSSRMKRSGCHYVFMSDVFNIYWER